MGFLAKANEAQAAAPVGSAEGGLEFKCIRCDRPSTDPEGVGTSLCPTCRPWIAGARLYPGWLIFVLSLASGPFVAGVLAWLNWKRVGDLRRAKVIGGSLAGLGVAMLFIGPAVFLPPYPFVSWIWFGVTQFEIMVAMGGFQKLLAAHEELGGRRESPIVPILVALVLAAPGAALWALGFRHVGLWSLLRGLF